MHVFGLFYKYPLNDSLNILQVLQPEKNVPVIYVCFSFSIWRSITGQKKPQMFFFVWVICLLIFPFTVHF